MAGIAVWNVAAAAEAARLGRPDSITNAGDAALEALRSFSRDGVIAAHTRLRHDAMALEASSLIHGTYRSCIPSYMVDDPQRRLVPSIPVPAQPVIAAGATDYRKNAVVLADLEVGRSHPGATLHGFLCVEAFRCSNVAVTALEDDRGRVARVLALNTLFWNSSQDEVERIFPQGAEVIVRDPCLLEVEFCQGVALWLANPLSLQVVEYYPGIGREKGGDGYLDLGSKELDQGENALAAVDLFTRSLNSFRRGGDEKKVAMALTRRAEAWIKLRRYDNSLDDVEVALSLDPCNVKSLEVKGKALLGLGQYDSSSLLFKQAVKASPSCAVLQSLCDSSLRLKEQRRTGVYDLSGYYLRRDAREDDAPQVADFIGPVKVAMTPDGRGRGLFVTKQVVPGELLVVTNAVALVFPDESCPVLELDKFGTLLTAVLKACMASRRTLSQVYTLAEWNPDTDESLDKEQVPDMELFQPGNRQHRQEELVLDVTRIANILHCVNESGSKASDILVTSDFDGLWTLPGFLNHSCLPNVGIHRVGAALFVVAARDMEPGTELVRSYGSALTPWNPMRRESIKVECRCERCRLEERLEPELKVISEKFDAVLSASSMLESEFHEQLADLAVDLEMKLSRLDVEEVERQWIRTSYCLAYISYYRNRGRRCEEAMPCEEDIARALHSTAPGFGKTLMAMCRLLGDGQCQELVQDECLASCGRQNHEVAAAIIDQARSKGKEFFW